MNYLAKFRNSVLTCFVICAPSSQAFAVDPLLPLQWHLGACGFDQSPSGAGIVIGAVDSGCNPHGDLIGRVLPGRNFYDRTSSALDGFHHGTACTALAVANSGNDWGGAGCLPMAQVLPLAVFPASGGSYDSSRVTGAIADAISYAKRQGIRTLWVNAAPLVITRAVRKAIEGFPGVICVATGDTGYQVINSNAFPNVAYVGGMEKDWTWANYSGWGPAVSFVAPSDCTYSAESGPTWAGVMTGTSIAVPIAASVCALVKAKHPDWTPAEVIQAVKDTCFDIDLPGVDSRTGYGLVDAWRAWSR